jgi:hypothetical protein
MSAFRPLRVVALTAAGSTALGALAGRPLERQVSEVIGPRPQIARMSLGTAHFKSIS